MGMTEGRLYEPKSIMLVLAELCSEICAFFSILYYVHSAGFTLINLGRHHVSDRKLHLTMM